MNKHLSFLCLFSSCSGSLLHFFSPIVLMIVCLITGSSISLDFCSCSGFVIARKILRYALIKKNDIIWEFFQNPLSPTPLFGNPLSKKNCYFFAFYALRNIFGFHQKMKILATFLHFLLGIGDPPPHSSPTSQNSNFFSSLE